MSVQKILGGCDISATIVLKSQDTQSMTLKTFKLNTFSGTQTFSGHE
jgi:hypothetical protein